MACCLTAPSHYLNHCWLIISKVLWHSSEDIIIRRFEDANQKSKIEDYIFEITLRSTRGQWVNSSRQSGGYIHQYITPTGINDGISSFGPPETSCSEILTEIHQFSYKKMNLKMTSAKMAAILSWPESVRPMLLPNPLKTRYQYFFYKQLIFHNKPVCCIFGRSIQQLSLHHSF